MNSLSRLAIGALHFGVYCDQKLSAQIIHAAKDRDINFIDTSPIYGQGKSENFVGLAVRGRRQDFVIASKVGLAPHFAREGYFGVKVEPLTQAYIRQSVERSLDALGTDYIDLLQLHAFDPHTPLEETFSTLQSLIQEGKIRAIGLSNYNHEQLKLVMNFVRATGLPSPQTFQVHYNLIERSAEKVILPIVQEHSLALVCNRALAKGVLTGRYFKNQPFPKETRAAMSERVRSQIEDQTLDLVQRISLFAAERQLGIVGLSLAWLLQQNAVKVVLIGARNLEQLAGCLRATERPLSSEELLEIESIIDQMDARTAVATKPLLPFEI